MSSTTDPKPNRFAALPIVTGWRDLRLRRKIVLAMVVIEIISVGILAYFALTRAGQIVNSLSNKYETSVELQTETTLNNIVQTAATDSDQLFSKTYDSLVKLADNRSQLETQKPTLSQGVYWDANTALSQLPGGQYGNSPSEIASVLVPSIVPYGENVISDLNTSAFLDFSAPGILKTYPEIVAIYYISASGTTTYYPNIDLANIVPGDFDARTQPFYTIANPQNNPGKSPRWTAPYQDPAGTGLIVTSSAPVYSEDGSFLGVMGIDMQLARIAENISQIKVGKTGFAFLVDDSGRILAMPPEGYTIFGLQPEEVPVNESPKETVLDKGSDELQIVMSRLVNGESGLATVSINDVENYVAFAPLKTPGYGLGVIVPTGELNAAIVASREEIQNETTSSLTFAVFILIGLLLGTVALSFGMGLVIAAPLVRLTQTVEKISAGDLSARATVEAQDETGILADAFNRMASQLSDLINSLEGRVAERTHSLVLAADVGRTVSQVRALDVMLKDAAEIIRSQFNLYYVQVYLTDAAQTALVLQSGTGNVGDELIARGHRLVLNTDSINGRAAVEKRSVVVSDTAESPTFRPNPLLPDTRSEMAIPLMIGEQVVGVLDLQSAQSQALNEDNLSAFEALAGQLAVAVQNATLLEEARQARAEVEAQARRLVRAGWQDYLDALHMPEQIGFAFEQNEVVPLENQETALPAEDENVFAASIALAGEQLGSLVVEVDQERQTAQTTELVNAVARQVAQQIDNLRLLESAERYRFEAEQAARRLTREGWEEYFNTKPNQSLGYMYDLTEVKPYQGDGQNDAPALTLPLKVRDETIGKLAVLDLESSDAESLELANAVAERLSGHIESLRLFEETQLGQVELNKRARQLAAVSQISTVSSRELDIQKMLTTVVQMAQKEFGLYHAHVFTYNERTKDLEIVACGWKEGEEHEGTHGMTTIPIDQEQSLVARAARSRTPIVVNDVRSDPGWLPNPQLPDTASELAVPLVIGDEVLGVLDVQSERVNAFTAEDINIQSTLASQVATALQNARSFARAQRQAERESMLNTISQKIQSATSVEAVLQIAARELGHALGAPRTIAQLSLKDKS